jgi:16S rRNA (uracil1498-N3)-methyltransferase
VQRITIDLQQIEEDRIKLDRSQSKYLTKVIRLQVGDRFQAIDGTGKLYLVEFQIDGAKIIEVVEIESPDLPINITLILAVPKGNGFDDTVRMCTELGVTKICPVTSDRTQFVPSTSKLTRWQKIAQEAAEQSERSHIPIVAAPMSLTEILATIEHPTDRYICEARGNLPHILDCLQPLDSNLAKDLTIAIGPEGGWSDRELQTAIDNNFQPVSIGSTILRAITAPVVAVSLVAGFYRSKSSGNG